MTRVGITALLLSALALAACGGDSDETPSNATPGVTAERTAAAAATVAPVESPAAQPTDAAPPGGASAEVQGIVGTVDAAADAIIINRISGADVKRVLVVPDTEIRDTRGNRLRLSQIRPSDRIVARGTIEGRDLIAEDVEIGQVVPGTSPG